MRYGELFKIVELTQQAKAKIDFAIANTQFEWEAGNINDDNISKLPDDHPFKRNYYDKDKQKVRRVSEIGWIPDQNLRRMMLEMCFQVNSQTEWNLNITAIEPVQFGIYPEGGKYDWHVDQHGTSKTGEHRGNLIRKISMSYWLNDPEEYEGGELDLEIYKPGDEPRYESFRLKKNFAVFFQSDVWHRVRPVTKGVRKSLVAWFSGPAYT